MGCDKTCRGRRKTVTIVTGDIDEVGTPMCPVIAAGQWSKRSYKTKYDAYSGAVS